MIEQDPKPRFWGQFRTQALTVGPRLIGASPVWAARSSYWRRPGLLYLKPRFGKADLGEHTQCRHLRNTGGPPGADVCGPWLTQMSRAADHAGHLSNSPWLVDGHGN